MASNFSPPADENSSTAKSGFFRLPQDVLGLIFEITQSMTRFSEQREGVDISLLQDDETTLPFIVLASHVSHAWRRTALDSPLMWSSINILSPWNPDMLAAYFLRSQTCQVALNIRAHSEDPPMADDLAGTISSLIRSHIHRCRTLSFDIDIRFTALLDGLSHTLRNAQAPVLDQLSLRGEGYHPITTKHSLCYTPALRDLRLGHFGLQNFSLPSQITVLHLDADKVDPSGQRNRVGILTVREFFDVLAACPVLETLAVYGDLLRYVAQSEVIPFDMPNLCSLQLYGVVMAPTILLFITAENLQHLVLAPLYAPDLKDVIFSRRSSTPVLFPSLKSLTISRIRTFTALQMASTCFPNIEQLNLIPSKSSESLIGVLECIRFPLWPNLHTISISGGDVGEIVSALAEWVTARLKFGCLIQRIMLPRSLLNLTDEPAIAKMDRLTALTKVEYGDVWGEIRQDGLYSPSYSSFH